MKKTKGIIKKLLGSFLKVGLIGFGGGSALIPIIEKEMVEEKKLLDKETYLQHTITANITPGALPVKLGGAAGEHLAGNLGMVLGSYAVTFPGVAITVILLSMISILSSEFLHYVEYVSIGVTAFILFLLTHYISKVLKTAKKQKFSKQAIFIIALTTIVTFGKEIRGVFTQVIGDLPPSLATPILDISTIDLLLITFFLIAGLGSTLKSARSIAVMVFSAMFVLFAGKTFSLPGPVFTAIKILIFLMICLFIYAESRKIKTTGDKVNLLKPLKQSSYFLGLIIILYIITRILSVDTTAFMLNGIISTVTSFGGGEAYLTVADGIFVGGGYVTPGEFYGQIVPIANALPGPILVKMLSGVGYIVGLQESGQFAGYMTATLGFAIGIGATMSVFSFLHEIYAKFAHMKFFRRLSQGILPVVCGLLVSTMLAMINESLHIIHGSGLGNIFSLTIFLGCFLLIYIMQKLKIHDVINIIVLGAFSLVIMILF
ncbi:chromate transporter [Alkalibacter saccharofermentans]|uniref:Chromate transporter n=1 Tax=Alkalibacter saccharofermentans DSM 14828 TaxID=1120975 RepID=A0A1M4U613_9FIRM|nr:chromate transporter [Alkalibacter saccharofermentans]SHE52179.1 chromate transporter [Alkalibacter saccharofermentans DSM 14828]